MPSRLIENKALTTTASGSPCLLQNYMDKYAHSYTVDTRVTGATNSFLTEFEAVSSGNEYTPYLTWLSVVT